LTSDQQPAPTDVTVEQTADDRIRLDLSPAAAGVLAAILARHDYAHHTARVADPGLSDGDYDSDTWTRVTIDLLAGQAMIRGLANIAERTAYARQITLEVPTDLPELDIDPLRLPVSDRTGR
jgi:hypothetical protein